MGPKKERSGGATTFSDPYTRIRTENRPIAWDLGCSSDDQLQLSLIRRELHWRISSSIVMHVHLGLNGVCGAPYNKNESSASVPNAILTKSDVNQTIINPAKRVV